MAKSCSTIMHVAFCSTIVDLLVACLTDRYFWDHFVKHITTWLIDSTQYNGDRLTGLQFYLLYRVNERFFVELGT